MYQYRALARAHDRDVSSAPFQSHPIVEQSYNCILSVVYRTAAVQRVPCGAASRFICIYRHTFKSIFQLHGVEVHDVLALES